MPSDQPQRTVWQLEPAFFDGENCACTVFDVARCDPPGFELDPLPMGRQPACNWQWCACGATFQYYAGWLNHINFEGEHVEV